MSSEYLQRLDVQGHLRATAVLVSWDPIQSSDPGYRLPEEEYKSHAIRLMALLDASAGKEEIVSFLRQLCGEWLHRPFDRKRAESAADELLDFWPRWKQELAKQQS